MKESSSLKLATGENSHRWTSPCGVVLCTQRDEPADATAFLVIQSTRGRTLVDGLDDSVEHPAVDVMARPLYDVPHCRMFAVTHDTLRQPEHGITADLRRHATGFARHETVVVPPELPIALRTIQDHLDDALAVITEQTINMIDHS